MTTTKYVFYGILALVGLLGLGITQSARANLINNGDFETGNFNGWTVMPAPTGSAPLAAIPLTTHKSLFLVRPALTLTGSVRPSRPPPALSTR
jgi:hypothetical protein